MFSSKNIRTSNIMWFEQVVYRTISTYNYIQVTTKDKKLKDRELERKRERHMEECEGRKGKRELL